MNILHLFILASAAAAYHLPNPLVASHKVRTKECLNCSDSSNLQLQPHLPWNHLSERRTMLSQIALTTIFNSVIPTYANAEDIQRFILEKRIMENSIAPPAYGMEATDIFYPSYFQGSWRALSKTTNINAPCGFELFPGGQTAYENTVQKEIKENDVLEYKARFVQSTLGDQPSTIADREYNAKEISKAAMGSFSVVDVSEATPNRFSCLLAPPEGSGGSLIRVDILAIARKYESVSSNKFSCTEVVRQIVSPANKSNPNAPPTPPLSVKEIETISVYTVNDSDNSTIKEIKCKQRTAMFLVPSQTDPIAFKKWQMSRGQPVDVRYYDVKYSKI